MIVFYLQEANRNAFLDQPPNDRHAKQIYHGHAGATYKHRKRMSHRTATLRVASWEQTPDDGFSWLKYGQKEIRGAKFPRLILICISINSDLHISCISLQSIKPMPHQTLVSDTDTLHLR
jgi:hypothetical protein